MKFNLNSLMAKIIFFGISLAFLSLAIFSSILLINQKNDLWSETQDKGLIFSEFSARSIYDDYVSFYTQSSDQGFNLFKSQVEKKMLRDKDLVQLSIISTGGVILFDSQEFVNGRYTGEAKRYLNDSEALALVKKSGVSYREIEINGTKALEVFAPIEELSGGHIFSVRYIISFASFNDKMIAAYIRVAWSFLLAAMFVFLLAIPLYRRIKKPIQGLNDLTGKIRQGNLDVKMETGSSKDEFAALAENFNAMVEELRVLRDKNFDYNQKLERDVKEKEAAVVQEKESSGKMAQEKETKIVELKKKIEELEKMNSFMIDREMKIIELKKKLDKE